MLRDYYDQPGDRCNTQQRVSGGESLNDYYTSFGVLCGKTSPNARYDSRAFVTIDLMECETDDGGGGPAGDPPNGSGGLVGRDESSSWDTGYVDDPNDNGSVFLPDPPPDLIYDDPSAPGWVGNFANPSQPAQTCPAGRISLARTLIPEIDFVLPQVFPTIQYGKDSGYYAIINDPERLELQGYYERKALNAYVAGQDDKEGRPDCTYNPSAYLTQEEQRLGIRNCHEILPERSALADRWFDPSDATLRAEYPEGIPPANARCLFRGYFSGQGKFIAGHLNKTKLPIIYVVLLRNPNLTDTRVRVLNHAGSIGWYEYNCEDITDADCKNTCITEKFNIGKAESKCGVFSDTSQERFLKAEGMNAPFEIIVPHGVSQPPQATEASSWLFLTSSGEGIKYGADQCYFARPNNDSPAAVDAAAANAVRVPDGKTIYATLQLYAEDDIEINFLAFYNFSNRDGLYYYYGTYPFSRFASGYSRRGSLTASLSWEIDDNTRVNYLPVGINGMTAYRWETHTPFARLFAYRDDLLPLTIRQADYSTYGDPKYAAWEIPQPLITIGEDYDAVTGNIYDKRTPNLSYWNNANYDVPYYETIRVTNNGDKTRCLTYYFNSRDNSSNDKNRTYRMVLVKFLDVPAGITDAPIRRILVNDERKPQAVFTCRLLPRASTQITFEYMLITAAFEGLVHMIELTDVC